MSDDEYYYAEVDGAGFISDDSGIIGEDSQLAGTGLELYIKDDVVQDAPYFNQIAASAASYGFDQLALKFRRTGGSVRRRRTPPKLSPRVSAKSSNLHALCRLSGRTYCIWTGRGGGHSWTDPNNWEYQRGQPASVAGIR